MDSQDLEHLGNLSSSILLPQPKNCTHSSTNKMFNQRKAKEIKEAVKITFLSGAVDGIPQRELLNLSSLPVFCTTTAVPVFSIWYFALFGRVKYFARQCQYLVFCTTLRSIRHDKAQMFSQSGPYKLYYIIDELVIYL